MTRRRRRPDTPRKPPPLGEGSLRRPPTEGQLKRIEQLCSELGKEVERQPQTEAEAYEWIGQFGEAVHKQWLKKGEGT